MIIVNRMRPSHWSGIIGIEKVSLKWLSPKHVDFNRHYGTTATKARPIVWGRAIVREAVATGREVFGTSPAKTLIFINNTLMFINNMAALQHAQGKHTDAEQLLSETLAWKRHSLVILNQSATWQCRQTGQGRAHLEGSARNNQPSLQMAGAIINNKY